MQEFFAESYYLFCAAGEQRLPRTATVAFLNDRICPDPDLARDRTKRLGWLLILLRSPTTRPGGLEATMRRRELLAGAAAVLVAGRDEEPGARPVPWSSGSETPRLKAPPGTTDCHHYVYDHRYPAFSDRIKRPDDATPHDYRALMGRLGIRRQVLVQPSAYGADNRCLLHALMALDGDARAVAAVDTAVADAVLKQFDRLGVRGLYFNFAPSNEATTAMMIEPLARRIAPLGWHVESNVWATGLPPLLPIRT